MSKPMTKKEWFDYLEKTWDAVQEKTWAEQTQALRQALAQPEQKGHCTCGDPKALGVVHFRTRPCFHYTEPPKREWVGLTDEDLSVFTTEFYNGAVWAEAKLKEKNYG